MMLVQKNKSRTIKLPRNAHQYRKRKIHLADVRKRSDI